MQRERDRRALEAEEQAQRSPRDEEAHGHQLEPVEAPDRAKRNRRRTLDGDADREHERKGDDRSEGAPERERGAVEADLASLTGQRTTDAEADRGQRHHDDAGGIDALLHARLSRSRPAHTKADRVSARSLLGTPARPAARSM